MGLAIARVVAAVAILATSGPRILADTVLESGSSMRSRIRMLDPSDFGPRPTRRDVPSEAAPALLAEYRERTPGLSRRVRLGSVACCLLSSETSPVESIAQTEWIGSPNEQSTRASRIRFARLPCGGLPISPSVVPSCTPSPYWLREHSSSGRRCGEPTDQLECR